MSDRLFDTWDGDTSTLEEDLSRVLEKHNAELPGVTSDQLAEFVSNTVAAAQDANGSSSEFVTSMFMLYKGARLSGRT